MFLTVTPNVLAILPSKIACRVLGPSNARASVALRSTCVTVREPESVSEKTGLSSESTTSLQNSALPPAPPAAASSAKHPERPRPESATAEKRFRLADKIGKYSVLLAGLFLIVLTIAIGAFLLYKGSATFTTFGHSITEFLFSGEWAPVDTPDLTQRGSVGAAIFILGSLMTCLLGLAIATPFAIGAAVFITEIAPVAGERLFRPAVELFLGIPSVVYGWIGLTVLVPFIRDVFHAPLGGYSVLAAGIVLAVMIFPTITTVAADSITAVPYDFREAAYGLGSTRWQSIYHIVLPAAKRGILTGIILGLARAFGEALAVAMVIGKTRAFPADILSPTSSLTTAITADMGNTTNGGEHNSALWTMALLLFIISMFFIFVIHLIAGGKKEK